MKRYIAILAFVVAALCILRPAYAIRTLSLEGAGGVELNDLIIGELFDLQVVIHDAVSEFDAGARAEETSCPMELRFSNRLALILARRGR